MGMRSEGDLFSQFQLYDQELFGSEDGTLFAEAKMHAQVLGKAQISISSAEGRILSFFVRLFACRNFVEVGTLTGYSALWILQGMSGGELFTLEKDPDHANVARNVLSKVSLSGGKSFGAGGSCRRFS